MRNERVIADSDDDDGFSPAVSPEKPSQPAVTALRSSDKTSHGIGSTDPAFFQSIYNAQQQAATVDDLSETIEADGEAVEEPEKQEIGEQLSTGIPHPTASEATTEPMPSDEAREGAVKNRDNATPAKKKTKTNSDYDPWAMPSSPQDPPSSRAKNNRGKGSVMKTYSKRNRRGSDASSSSKVIDLVLPAAPSAAQRSAQSIRSSNRAPQEEPSPLPARKRRRTGDRVATDGAWEDDSGDMDIPLYSTDGDLLTKPRPGTTDVSRSSRPTANKKGIYVEPPKLTSSQMKEYQEVHLPSTDPVDSDLPMTAPLPPAIKSSGSATIAYPTPTQFRHQRPAVSSLIPTQGPAALQSSKSTRRSSSVIPEEPNSSPDILSEVKINCATKRPAKLSHLIAEDDELDGDWNEQDHGFPGSRSKPRNTRKKYKNATRQGPSCLESTAENDGSKHAGMDASDDKEGVLETMAKPKKRGRPKKAIVDSEDETGMDEINHGDGEDDAGEAEVILESKKRGRLKEKIPAQREEAGLGDVLLDEEDADFNAMPKPTKRGRPKKESLMDVEDDFGGDVTYGKEEDHVPAVGQRKKRGRPKKETAIHIESDPFDEDAVFGNDTLVEEPRVGPLLKKRGRKKKEVPNPRSAETVSAEDLEGEQTEAEPQPQKKRRGRPKKSGKVGNTDNETPPDKTAQISEPGDGSRTSSVDPHVQNERPSENLRASAKTVRARETLKRSPRHPRVLAESSQNSVSSQPDSLPAKATNRLGSDADGGTNQENVTEESHEDTSRGATKLAVPVPQSGKPLYRVGLSKRTRIAPLLKVIRKS